MSLAPSSARCKARVGSRSLARALPRQFGPAVGATARPGVAAHASSDARSTRAATSRAKLSSVSASPLASPQRRPRPRPRHRPPSPQQARCSRRRLRAISHLGAGARCAGPIEGSGSRGPVLFGLGEVLSAGPPRRRWRPERPAPQGSAPRRGRGCSPGAQRAEEVPAYASGARARRRRPARRAGRGRLQKEVPHSAPAWRRSYHRAPHTELARQHAPWDGRLYPPLGWTRRTFPPAPFERRHDAA